MIARTRETVGKCSPRPLVVRSRADVSAGKKRNFIGVELHWPSVKTELAVRHFFVKEAAT
jgi:hypothetical protein